MSAGEEKKVPIKLGLVAASATCRHSVSGAWAAVWGEKQRGGQARGHLSLHSNVLICKYKSLENSINVNLAFQVIVKVSKH